MLSVWIGATVFRRLGDRDDDTREDVGIILSATLTLLGLVVGFSYSMATSRFDERKHLEDHEAVAIRTVYQRANLLLPGDVLRVRGLLRDYYEQRMLFLARAPARPSAISTSHFARKRMASPSRGRTDRITSRRRRVWDPRPISLCIAKRVLRNAVAPCRTNLESQLELKFKVVTGGNGLRA